MNILFSRIQSVTDTTFHALVDEIYASSRWIRDDKRFSTLRDLLESVKTDCPAAYTNASSKNSFPLLAGTIGGIESTTIQSVCLELITNKGDSIDIWEKKSLRSLLLKASPKGRAPRRPSRGEERHDAMRRLIEQRRANQRD